MTTMRTTLTAALLATLTLPAAARAEEAKSEAKPVADAKSGGKPDAAGVAFFEQNIRPLLAAHCLQCHSRAAKKVRGGLALDTRAGWMKGGDSGPAIVPGDPAKSLLVQVVHYEHEPKMPPKGKLPEKEIALLAEWVKMGAPDPRDGAAPAAEKKPLDLEAARKYWAFAPLPESVPAPEVKDPAGWCRTPVDRFVLAKLQAKGIDPNLIADRRKLIRRAHYDLTGLPPTPEEVERFLADDSTDAYEKLIDRLVASPHFGERWGRHWLDVARFAESHGYEQDYDRPNAFHYRDFVIKALNSDLPYDTFVKWQIAGDEYEPDNPLAMMATGFLAAGTHATQITANQAEKERYDELDDIVRTIGTTMLGLTVGCARCHDHKYDPIPVADYYRMVATFSTTVRSDYDLVLNPSEYRPAKAAWDAEHAPLVQARERHEREEIPKRYEAWRKSAATAQLPAAGWSKKDKPDAATANAAALRWFRAQDADWVRLDGAVRAHEKDEPKAKSVKALISSEGVPAVRLHTQGADFYDPVYHLKRGDSNQKLEVAKPGYLGVLMRTPKAEAQWQAPPPTGAKTSFRRRAFAEWLTDANHGAGHLLARVIVNRLWHHHMGRGIVATPSDFGLQGEKPTHPELLDFLARELIRGGWRLKPIHRLIMTSAVYRQSADWDEARASKDRENTLFWRRPVRRLEAEIIRDAMLAASGSLDATPFGPGTLDMNHRRRSIYFFVKRSKLIPMMSLFDAPDSLQDISVRPATVVAPQALMLMNSPLVRGWSAALAARARPSADTPPAAAVRAAYGFALSRPPTDAELADAVAFLKAEADAYRAEGKPPAEAGKLAMTDFCQTLFCLNEFVYVD
jgi:mono/diheme cytochrome c family protein